VSEVLVLPEMLSAGVEALGECRKRKLTEADTAVAVYLAMSAIYEMYAMRDPKVIH
jgi:hypothetical protein